MIYFILQPDCLRALKNILSCKKEKNYSEINIIKEIESADELASESTVKIINDEISELIDETNDDEDENYTE